MQEEIQKTTYKYGVRLLKNRLYPVKIPKNNEEEVVHGQPVLIMTEKGQEVAKILRISDCVFQKWGNKLPEPIPFIRTLSEVDMQRYESLQEKENIAFQKCGELVEKHRLPMRLINTKYTFDERKITFYYTAPHRIDFRELLKDLTQTFRKVRIDLRHIGVRDETAILEGLGLCGKEFCCCTFLSDFASINIKLAKDQGMPINPSKISGVCGRLLCCLNYEYSNYIEAAVGMPPVGSGVMTPDGIGKVAALHFLVAKVLVKLEDGRIKEFAKNDIEMIEEDVGNIELDYNVGYQEEEVETIDIAQLEDDDSSYTTNI
jgi:cell fate regulator YaaT (PSP1 superfamily)